MSILIKGMEMPTSCYDCSFSVEAYEGAGVYSCVVTDNCVCKGAGRHDDCPLVPVPKPHGRLIDADALMHEFEKAQQTMAQNGREYSCSFMSSSQEISTEWYCVEDMVENAPTIIPSSGGIEDE